MPEKIAQQVSVLYNSDIINMPGELVRIAQKHRCGGFEYKGNVCLNNPQMHSYEFLWPLVRSENVLKFVEEVKNLEKTVSVDVQEL